MGAISKLPLLCMIYLTLGLYSLSTHGFSNKVYFETDVEKKVKDHLNYLEVEYESIIECAALCAREERCLSAIFNDNDGSCRLSAENVDGPDNQEKITDESASSVLSKHASKVGEKCTSTSSCVDTNSICSNSTCFCHAMYVYNTSVADCVRRCSNREDSFEVYNDVFLLGFNDRVISANTAEECKNPCILDPFYAEFWININPPWCSLGRVSYKIIEETKPELLKNVEGAIVYSRK